MTLNNSVFLDSGILDRHSHGRAERIWQPSYVIINSQTGNEAGHAVGGNWVGGSYPEDMVLRIFRILKKKGIEVRPSKQAFEFFGSDRIRSVWVGIIDITRCAAQGRRRCHHSMVIIGFYKLCISSRVAKGGKKKEINLFVSETMVSLLLLISSWAI